VEGIAALLRVLKRVRHRRPVLPRAHIQPADAGTLAAIAIEGDAVLVAGERIGDLVGLDAALAVRLDGAARSRALAVSGR
jgi:hypothetical protein